EVGPLGEEAARGIKDLDAIVGAIGHIDTAFGIYRDAMRHIELAGGRAFAAPPLDEHAVPGEARDARIWAFAIGDQDVAILLDRDIAHAAHRVVPLLAGA